MKYNIHQCLRNPSFLKLSPYTYKKKSICFIKKILHYLNIRKRVYRISTCELGNLHWQSPWIQCLLFPQIHNPCLRRTKIHNQLLFLAKPVALPTISVSVTCGFFWEYCTSRNCFRKSTSSDKPLVCCCDEAFEFLSAALVPNFSEKKTTPENKPWCYSRDFLEYKPSPENKP